MERNEIIQKFKDEFSGIADKFEIIDLTIDKAKDMDKVGTRPGIYVFWKDGSVIKVGRHLQNARKRALEHVRDNTGGTMNMLDKDNRTHLLLFTIKDQKDAHWLFALEDFFEMNLNPKIKSDRRG